MKNKITIALLFLLTTSITIAQDAENTKKTSTPNQSPTGVITEKSVEKKQSKESADLEAKQRFIDKAKNAALTVEKTNEILTLISKRAEELKSLTAEYKKNGDYSVMEPTELYNSKMRAVRNRYLKLINTSLTYIEFAAMMVDDYRAQANENSKLEFKQLVNANPKLSKEQLTKIYETIYNFHSNELMTKAYLSFDVTLQKPRLGILRFEYEKAFASLCKEYNIKTATTTETNNSFQWNN